MVGNGGETEQELPDRRKAAVAAGLEQYNHIANERDKFEQECRELRTQIAGYKVAAEADQSRILELESRNQSMMLERDKAVRERGDLLGLFKTIKATLYAFDVPFPDKIDEAERAVDTQNAMARQQMAQQQDTPRPYYREHFGIPASASERANLSKPPGSS